MTSWRSYPAPIAIRLLLVGVVLGIGSIFFAPLSGVLLVWLLAVLLTMGADRHFHPPCSLRIEGELPPRLVLGRPFEAQLTVHNAGPGSVSCFGSDHLPLDWEADPKVGPLRLKAGESRQLLQSLRPLRRGAYSLGPLHLIQVTGLGLWRHHGVVECPREVRVYPDYRPGTDALDPVMIGEVGIRRTRQRGEGTDFESLREYRVGDDTARIDWKATARLGKAMSRQYTIEKDHDVMIGIDCGRLMGARFDGMAKFDHAMRAALVLAEVSLRSGDRVGLMVFDAKVRRFVPPGKGSTQLGILLEALHDVESTFEETDFHQAMTHLGTHHRKRSLVVMITDFIDRQTAKPMLLGMEGAARRHACLFVAVEDPTLGECLNEVPQGLHGLASQAVAYGMRQDRREVLELLRNQGVDVVDELPDRLTAPVLNGYLAIKRSGRL